MCTPYSLTHPIPFLSQCLPSHPSGNDLSLLPPRGSCGPGPTTSTTLASCALLVAAARCISQSLCVSPVRFRSRAIDLHPLSVARGQSAPHRLPQRRAGFCRLLGTYMLMLRALYCARRARASRTIFAAQVPAFWHGKIAPTSSSSIGSWPFTCTYICPNGRAAPPYLAARRCLRVAGRSSRRGGGELLGLLSTTVLVHVSLD